MYTYLLLHIMVSCVSVLSQKWDESERELLLVFFFISFPTTTFSPFYYFSLHFFDFRKKLCLCYCRKLCDCKSKRLRKLVLRLYTNKYFNSRFVLHDRNPFSFVCRKMACLRRFTVLNMFIPISTWVYSIYVVCVW